ncbi:MAG: DUF58 domain-containing protein [Myxococcales bacterium]|nr:DUF58 domain-containing protein [Myxococcales bacterium]
MDPARDPRPHERSALRRRAAQQPRYFAHARRWLRAPRRLHPTGAGWSFFAFTFAVGFAALNTGNNLLYMILALMLAFLVLSGALSESALRGIQVRRRLPRELQAGSDALVALEIRNTQRRVAAFAIGIEDRMDGALGAECAAGRCFVLRIGPGHSEVRSYRLRPERRGPLAFRGFLVFTRFPFGLFSKSLLIDAPEQTLVYPAIDPVAIPAEFGATRARGERVSTQVGAGADVRGLREYAPGDSLRRVHWRSSLRAGALLVREAESEQDAEIEVRLRTAGEIQGDAFERRVRGSASEIAALLDAGTRVALRTECDYFPADAGPRQRARLLSFLALVQPCPAESRS